MFLAWNFINFFEPKKTKNEQVTIQSLIIQIYPPTLFSLFQRKFIVFIKKTRNEKKWSTRNFFYVTSQPAVFGFFMKIFHKLTRID